MLSGRWTNSHRYSWITVYVFCCNAQLNFIIDTMTCTCIVMVFSTCQLPSCNLFTQHVSYLWRDTTSELWTPVYSFASEYTIYCNHYSLHFPTSNHHFPTIHLILCFQQASEIDNLTISWGKVSWLCCVQVSHWIRSLWYCAVLSFIPNTFKNNSQLLLVR